jgi:hypothetical protein
MRRKSRIGIAWRKHTSGKIENQRKASLAAAIMAKAGNGGNDEEMK